ncbi:MAG: hypothetical protein SF069_06515 [Phycisphaerae bacterium]|nr:hypothetical protein [Phycisphaerae bacterium]
MVDYQTSSLTGARLVETLKRPRRVLKTVLWLLTSLLMAAVLLFFMHRASLKVVYQWCQPSGIAYDDWGPYYVSVVEADLDWRGFPIHVERNYFLYVGRDAGTPSHGHMIKFSFHPSSANYYDLPGFLKRTDVQWTAEGVELRLESGHRLFVPKDMFVGGR